MPAWEDKRIKIDARSDMRGKDTRGDVLKIVRDEGEDTVV